ncbi:hypothetical protein E2C01_102761 [Portunus trituberculatus]|uniref:Uncharacterized protein n=1 Tax=Portunus trituberculatus TaxID=210409 RepID=A0A5B7KJ45_PORTR|nr:hypothetical protein [Portunus trituberculatus]
MGTFSQRLSRPGQPEASVWR